MVEGPVSLSTEPAEVRRWAGEIGGRYMGEDRIEEMAEVNGGPGEMVVRVSPERVVSEDKVAIDY